MFFLKIKGLNNWVQLPPKATAPMPLGDKKIMSKVKLLFGIEFWDFLEFSIKNQKNTFLYFLHMQNQKIYNI